MKILRLEPRYLKQFPEQLEEGVLYISEEFSLTGHKCCCGCGEDVYLKLGPAKWQLSWEADGTVSLSPSVGNWKYACRSHYWISGNDVLDAGQMGARTIQRIQRRDREDRQRYIAAVNAQSNGNRRSIWQQAKHALDAVCRRIKETFRDL